MKAMITCSCCGKNERFTYTGFDNVTPFVDAGWGSFGSALYCPKCSETWNERNSKPMGSRENTIRAIYNFIRL